MIFALLAKEVKIHAMTFRFGAAMITMFVLIVLSAWVLGEEYLQNMDTYNKVSEQAAANAAKAGLPSRAAPMLNYPPSALSVFAQGEEKRLGNSVQIKRWEVPRIATDSLSSNVLVNDDVSFDFLTIVTFIVSLFAVLISYDSICGERENGTLKLIATCGISRAAMFGSKLLGCLIVIVIALLINFLSALLILIFVHGIVFSVTQWLATGLILINAIVYGAVFVAVGLLSSALVKRSSVSLVIALLVWSLGVWMIPVAATQLASTFFTIPSPCEIQMYKTVSSAENTATQKDLEQTFYDKRINSAGSHDRFGEQTSLFDGNPQAFRLRSAVVILKEKLGREQGERIWQIAREHDAAMKKQVSLRNWLAAVAPAHHLQANLKALAGTNYRNNEIFIERARRYRREMLNEFDRRGYFTDNVIEFYSRIPAEQALSETDYRRRFSSYRERTNRGENIIDILNINNLPPLAEDTIPVFDFKVIQPQIASTFWPLAFLVLEFLMLFIVGYIMFLRYDIR